MTEPVIAARLGVPALQDRLASPGELAVLDVREAGRAFDRHLLFSSVAPVGRLGLLIDRLVPRRSTPVVLVDDNGAPGGDAELAAAALARFGYADVQVLAGGVDAWAAAGHEIFSGTNVPSKAFGEIVEHALGTPNIDAATLAALQAQGADLVVLDSRPFDEFRRMSIPGALDCPGAELLYRALDVAPSPQTLIVVNCAGRTRSIIGAQSLINAGVPNPVAALTGGSMAWLLEGLTLDHGAIRHAPRPSEAALSAARALAATLAERAQVPLIDAAQLQRFEAEQGTRTLYRFDVRDPAEYAAGHAPGWRHAAGGQLVQATDEYVGTRGARIVLTDTDGVRARLTASWLQQLGGYEVYVIDRAPDALAEIGPEPLRVLRGPEPIDWIEPSALQARLDAARTVVIDVD
uniref:rhodanese-like domain-containing protein n=1 Tax=Burkholderia sp. Ac-20379 TaxID=2703900 RepID=UPI00197EF5F8